MPTSSLTGKSKDDLATIAAVSGLLSREQAMAMTKPELMKFLKNAEAAAKAPPQPLPETISEPAVPAVKATRKTTKTSRKTSPEATAAPRKVSARKKSAAQGQQSASGDEQAPAVAVDEPRLTIPEPVAAPDQVVASATETIEAAQSPVKSKKPRRKSASETTSASVSAGPEPAAHPEQHLPQEVSSLAEQETKSQVEPPADLQGEQQAVFGAREPGKRAADTGNAVKRPAYGKNKFQERYSAKNQPATRNQDRNQPRSTGKGKARTEAKSEDKRPMRVKVFGIPANPMAGLDHEPEAAPPILPENALVHAPVQPLTETMQPVIETMQSAPPVQIVQTVDETAVAGESNQEQALPDKEPTPSGASDKFNRKQQIESGESITGVLEIMPDGYGFLRRDNYLQGAKDAYVPPQYIRRFNLRPGDLITGPCKKQRDNDRYQALLYIKEVNGQSPDKMIRRPHFDRLTPIYPDERYVLETVRNELSTRIIDLVAPIGKGQRGMIVSPPKAGKTILLQKIANAISANNPDVKLIVLLIDERPEEVTDMQRSINGEVVFSTFDKTPENHVKVTELVLERAMRLVELKQDVVILLDSMTRLARAYNLTITPTGRTLSGGLDPGALYGPKRFFGAARNIENGGSLTIIATSLIETGSRMDEVIFEEFKGTGNMEVYLDRKLSEKRIFPAIDINRSGTRREELLLTDKELDAVWTIRKAFGQLDTAAVTETIINLLLKTQNNQQFISSINVSFNDKNVFDAMRGTRPGQTNGNTQSSGGPGNVRRNYDRDND